MASLRALECLVAVADCGSITQAAQLLHSSQPAVSHQLAMLEREAGTALLRRAPRGVKLTPAGRAAVSDARRAVEAATSAVAAARAVGSHAGGTLRLACGQSLTIALLAPVMREWHQQHPDVVITLRESTSLDELIGFLDADEADVVIMPASVGGSYPAVTIAEEEIVLATPIGHPLSRKRELFLRDLDGASLVHFAPQNGLSSWLDLQLARAGARPVPVMRTSVTSAAPQLAAAGMGVAVCPVSAISDGFPGSVRSFSPVWTREIVAVTPGEFDPLVSLFVADLQSHGIQVPAGVLSQLTSSSSAGRT